MPNDVSSEPVLPLVQAYLRMCGLPVHVVCKANAEYMSPSGEFMYKCSIVHVLCSSGKCCLNCFYVFFFSAGKIPFIHVGNQVVSELGPIVQFTKAKVNENYTWT